jgi:integrase
MLKRPSDQNQNPQTLTDAGVKKLPPPAAGNRLYRDTAVPGFAIRVTAGGHRAFVLDYRTRAGRKRRFTIGAFPNWTTGAARIKARELKRLVDAGGDPQGELEDARAAPIMPELIERFRAEHLTRRRAGTRTDYESMLKRHIEPHFGNVKVDAVTHRDVEALHRRLTSDDYPYRANRVVAVLSKLFSLAVKWNMRTDGVNPARGIEKNTEHHRRRYLEADELAALLKALAAYSDQRIAAAFRLLLLTGARRGEVLAMRWADLDLGAGTWSKPAASTKQNKPHEVPLSAPALQILARIRDEQIGRHRPLPEFVFSGAGQTGHVVEIKKAWRTICKAAGLADLRIHDLRHSFASEIASAGGSLPLIGALLGHSNPQTTARYTHLFRDPLREASERAGASIMAAAGETPPAAPPIPLKPRRRP